MAICSFSDLKDTHIFITGGGSGIGADFVRAFIEQGANVSFVSLAEDNAELLCDSLEKQFNRRPFFQQCDINNIPLLTQCINNASERFGPVNTLINNAARDTRHTLEELTPDQGDESINTNLRPHFFTAQAVTAAMKEHQAGSIINVSSNSALLGLSGYPAYVTAKAGIIGLTKALARELGADNIRVNALIPGWVMTERQKRLWATPESVQQCMDEQCLKTSIVEEDVSNLALFLASKASAMITGQSLIIDGGRV